VLNARIGGGFEIPLWRTPVFIIALEYTRGLLMSIPLKTSIA
jgi:hypothetical protein